MKQFFKFMFASMLGFFLSCIILFFLFFVIAASIASFSKKTVVIADKSVLCLRLDQPIPERSTENPFSSLSFGSMNVTTQIGLNDILKNIKKAGIDPKIKGIYLELGDVPAGMATIESIREALLEFKKSGKFIISYSDAYSQKAYYLACISDKVLLNPEGSILLKGLSGSTVFFKGALEKLEIDAQIIRHGKYKSAVEPFMLDKMSPENKEQTMEFVGDLWAQMVNGMAKARKLAPEDLNSIADKLGANFSEDALKYKLVDSLCYKDGVLALLRKKLGISADTKIPTVTAKSYDDAVVKGEEKYSGKEKIAVIFACGDIVEGEGADDNVGSEKISRALRKARLDKNVKAVVLRINSPGGSALASEVILREVMLIKKEKPIVASMGDVAGSGGYYIACAANKIIAQPNTITGSIGVLGIIPNFQRMFKDKLGITFDEVMTNENSNYITTNKPLTEYQNLMLTKEIERVYKVFVKHVSEGRGMTFAEVDSIGQGRVWSGMDAKSLRLIDDFGGLDKAIETAASLAKLKDYKKQYLPDQKDVLQQIMDELKGKYQEDAMIKKELGPYYPYFETIRNLQKMDGLQTRMPFDYIIR